MDISIHIPSTSIIIIGPPRIIYIYYLSHLSMGGEPIIIPFISIYNQNYPIIGYNFITNDYYPIYWL